MQNKVIRSFIYTAMLALLLVPAACQRVERPSDEDAPMRAQMDLTIDRWGMTETKSTSAPWPNNACFFVQLTNGNDSQVVEVIYVESRVPDVDFVWQVEQLVWSENQGWESRTPDLTGYSGGHCKCFYFENEDGTYGRNYEQKSDGTLGIQPTTPIYYDDDAIFSIVDGGLGVKAHLEPLTGRIRFAYPGDDHSGANWYYPGVYGMRSFVSLDLRSFELRSSTSYISTYVESNSEWSQYLYGFFADPERRVLTVADGKWSDPDCYERSFAEDILAPGCSNWTYLPLSDNHNEWYRYPGSFYSGTFGINDEEFRVIYVAPGTFEMGGEDAQPIHTVTLTKGYYLCQAEVTKNFWYQVMGSPNDYANKSVPVTGKTWDEVQDFIAALNAKTGYRFRLPTEAEWEFAARGGLKSKGYMYSGSDRYSDVAVQDWNWSPQAVKTRDANEISFFDMSGNVAEWVSDWYAVYPTDPVVDPTGPETGEAHIRRGGNRAQDTRFLTVTYRDVEETDLSMTGFRLAMDAPRIK